MTQNGTELYEYISWSMNGEMLLRHSSLGVTFSIKAVHNAFGRIPCQCILRSGQQLCWSIYCGKYMANYLFIDTMHFLEIHLQDKLLHKVPVHWLASIVNATFDTRVTGDFCRSSRCEKWEQLCISYIWHWNNAGTRPDLRYTFHRLRERERTGVKRTL